MTSDPRSQQFWNEHADGLRNEISEVVINTIFAGVGAGVDGLPGSLEALVDWDVVNRDALSYLESYLTYTPGQPSDAKRWRWLTELTETTRRDVVNEINGWVQRGDPLSELEARLTPIFGPKRAQMIASTEVTRIYAEGNMMAWKSTGLVEGKRWQTAVDDLVCPICGPLHGIEVPIDADFEGGFSNPPAHPRCRCWVQPVTITVEEEEVPEQISQVYDLPEIPEFKTIEEGFDWIYDNLETPVDRMSGQRILKETIQQTAKELQEIEHRIGHGMPGGILFDNNEFKYRENTWAFYDANRRKLIMRGNATNKLNILQEANENYRWFASPNFKGQFTHEIVHVIDDDAGRSYARMIKSGNTQSEVQNVSVYAVSDWTDPRWAGSEAVAEIAAAYVNGQEDRLTPNMLQVMQRIFRR